MANGRGKRTTLREGPAGRKSEGTTSQCSPQIQGVHLGELTSLPLVMLTVLKLFALFKVMSLAAPAAKVVVPATTRAPLSVIAPLVVTFKVPLTVDAPEPGQ